MATIAEFIRAKTKNKDSEQTILDEILIGIIKKEKEKERQKEEEKRRAKERIKNLKEKLINKKKYMRGNLLVLLKKVETKKYEDELIAHIRDIRNII